MGNWASECWRGAGISFFITNTLYSEQSEYQQIDILESSLFGRMLFLDGVVMLSERDEYIYHEMITHIPMMAHPNPKKVLIIGGGDGGTVREVLKHEQVESITLCEIDGLVIDACKTFLPELTSQLDNKKVTIKIADGIQYMKEEAQGFDVIIIDSTDGGGPAEPLFTKEFYQNAYNALNSDGILVAQTNSPYTYPERMYSVYAILPDIFPIVQMYTANIPTFLHGLYTWAFCSKKYTADVHSTNLPKGQNLEKTCQYYNLGIHKASFLLPNFLHQIYTDSRKKPISP